MQKAKGIIIPLIADYVLSPDVYYGDEVTGIYFSTEDDSFGRITFENLDAIRICRGEILPYSYVWEEGQIYPWIYEIENSNWLDERYTYEKKYYGDAYEFSGNVGEMKMDFKHYLFKFHDQFVEVIARGFWFEKDEVSLLKKELQEDHPLLPLPDTNADRFIKHSLCCQIRRNPKPEEILIANAQYCSQTLMEFALELDGTTSINHSLVLSYRNGKLMSVLRGYFGNQGAEFTGVANFQDVKPYLERYMYEVSERRKAMGK